MKLLSLDLLAFGVFTATRLEFDPDRPFQVVLGPNAAGKSTALRAITDLLFGIPERTSDDFLHRKDRLRLGAELAAADGRRLSFLRRKGRKDTLLEPAGKVALPDVTLRPFLGEVDRTLFTSMFGLGHEALRRGAEDLLQAGGALGESLFEAAGGTRSVRAVLATLAAEADVLFKKGASIPTVNAAIGRYNEARQAARQAALAGEDYLALEQVLAALATASDAQRQELARLDAEQRKLERVQRNLPRLAARDEILVELRDLAGVPDLPAEAREERLALLGRRHQRADQALRDEAEIARLAGVLQGLDTPQALLDAAGELQRLNENLGAVRKANADQPKLRAELAALRDTTEQLLAEVRGGLTLAAAAALRVSKPKAKRIRELADQHHGLRATRGAAAQAVVLAQAAAGDAAQALAAAPPPRDMRPLADAVQAVQREGSLLRDAADSATKRAAAWRRARAEAATLHGWRGALEALESLPVPMADTVQRFATSLPAAAGEAQRARERVEERAREQREIEAEIKRLHAAGVVPTPAQLAEARQRRDAAWRLLRRAYVDGDATARSAAAAAAERPLPEVYEEQVANADALADALRSDAERVARDQALQRGRGEGIARSAEARDALAAVAAGHAALAAEWAALWAPLAVAPLPPAEMLAWVETHRRVRDLAGTARDEDGRQAGLAQEIARCQGLLREALRAVGETAPASDEDLGLLLTRCQRSLHEAEAARRGRDGLEQAAATAQAGICSAEQQRSAAEAELAEWQTEWASLIGAVGHDAGASPREVEESQALVEQALAQDQAANDLQRRLRRMEEDAEEFRTAVAAVAAPIAPDLFGQPAERVLSELTARHRQAADNVITRSGMAERLATLRDAVDAARRDLETTERRLEALVRRAACDGVDNLEAVEAQAERKRLLTGRRAELEGQLVEDGAGLTLAELLDEVRDQDGDLTAARRAALREQLQTLQAERDAGLQQHGERRRERDTMLRETAAAAQKAEDAEAELAHIRAGAEEYMRLRLAEVVLREFVERYRERHQDPILTRASQLFPLLTLQTFSAVRTDYDDADQPVLVGVDRGGAALGVAAMSDGTRDQLYLALRLAAVEQYLASAEPPPFVADDLLVHFDDDRAGAALRVLADFSRRTQVLFFTHHPHLVELARREVPPELLQVQSLTPASG